MDGVLFINSAAKLIASFYQELREVREDVDIPEDFKIYPVWITKVLKNNKGLFSTEIPDAHYFEITYDGDKQAFYFDSYVKELNQEISLENVVNSVEEAAPEEPKKTLDRL